MYEDNVILCVIPARGGSKKLPGKNIKKLLGKPLIAYTIEHANQSHYIDRTIVSTDSWEIAEVSRQYGAEVPFMRPQEFATDEVGTIDVLLHAIDWMENKEGYLFDILLLLQVTSPLRNVEDIDNCIELLVEKNADSIFSVTEAHGNPYFSMVEVAENGIARLVKEGDFVTRQSAPQVFDINGSVYVWWKDILKAKKRTFLERSYPYIMPKERSVDIDDEMDFMIAEMMLKQKTSNG